MKFVLGISYQSAKLGAHCNGQGGEDIVKRGSLMI